VEAAAGHQPQPFLVTPFSERKASFSPDGKWLAYVSDESGQDEVYVQRFPETGEKLQISVGGGDEPGWAPSGRELFYRNAGKMMAVPVTTTPKFVAGKPLLLFGGLYFYNTLPNRSYDVAPDGRFVMVKEPAGEGAPRNINVILNWGGELKRLVRPP
jgi:serine/threonine-protein kinase